MDYTEAINILKEEMSDIKEVETIWPSDMTADELCKIFVKEYPEIFDYWYRFCNMVYKSKNDTHFCQSEENRKYWMNDELNFAKGILYDCSREFANKVGKILVAATE